jgi:hypothetical protein
MLFLDKILRFGNFNFKKKLKKLKKPHMAVKSFLSSSPYWRKLQIL